MTWELAIATLTGLIGFGVTLLTAGVPWAFSVHGRLARIEATLLQNLDQAKRIDRLERRMTWLEAKEQGKAR